MENKQSNQPANQQEVTIQLTEEQQKQIKRATGQLVTELKVQTVEDRANPDWLMTPAGH